VRAVALCKSRKPVPPFPPSLRLKQTQVRWLPYLCSAHLQGVLLLLRQRRVAAGNGLVTGLGTTIKYVRRTASGAASNVLGIAIKYLRRLRNGISSIGLGGTIKYV
jgi:hypothetical protein